MSTPEGGFPERLGQEVPGPDLAVVGPSAGHDRRAAAGGYMDRVLDGVPPGEGEGETGSEAIAGSVGVDDRARTRRRAEWAAGLDPPAEPAGGRDRHIRGRIQVARPVDLGLVLPASDHRIELD